MNSIRYWINELWLSVVLLVPGAVCLGQILFN